MPVRYEKFITREMLRAAPDTKFVFGDNIACYGLGGQAKAMRGEPNAIGVATLYEPGRFYDNNPEILFHVARDLKSVALALSVGTEIVVPLDGLGTGFGRLIEHRPDIHNLIVAFFKAADGEPCTWAFVETAQ